MHLKCTSSRCGFDISIRCSGATDARFRNSWSVHGRPRHEYELRRALGELGFWKVSFGSLYPSLRRVEKREAIEATKVSGRPKAYKITEEGREAFDSLLRSDPEATETARGFQIRLAFLGHLPPDRRLQVMDRRRRELSTQFKAAWEIPVEAFIADRDNTVEHLARFLTALSTRTGLPRNCALRLYGRGRGERDKSQLRNPPPPGRVRCVGIGSSEGDGATVEGLKGSIVRAIAFAERVDPVRVHGHPFGEDHPLDALGERSCRE